MTHPHSSEIEAPHEPAARPSRRDGLTLLLLALAQAMLVLDVTVVNVALPVLSRELGLEPGLAGWAIAAYAVPFGGLLILGGRLTDVFGARRMLLAGLALFTVASLAAGLATDSTLFLGARAAQGVGAALLSPAALATLLHRFEGPARRRALAVWGAVGGAGAAIGVLLGGLLTGGPGWRWIFFINVPIGIAVAIAVPLVVAGAVIVRRGRVDVLGAVLATAGAASLVAAISSVELMEPAVAWALAAVSVLLLGGFAIVQRRSAHPLVRLGLLRSRPVASGSMLMLVSTGLLVGGFFMFSFELQGGAGWSPIATGLAFLPISVGVVAGAHLGARAIGRLGARIVAPTGLIVATIGLTTTTSTISADQGPALAIVGMTVAALGLGAGFVSASTTALSLISGHEAGTASGVLNSFHELGSAVGVAFFAAIAVTSLPLGFGVAAAIAAITAVVAALVLPAGVTGGGEAKLAH